MKKAKKFYFVNHDGQFTSIYVVYRMVGLDWEQNELNPKQINEYEYFTTFAKAKKVVKEKLNQVINDYKYSLWQINRLKDN